MYIAKNFARLHRQDPHKFAAYLVSCTRSRAFLLLAQRQDAPGEEEPDFDRNADPAPVPEDAVIDEQQAQHLMQAVQQLAPIYRDPLRLLAQGYTYREIAAALACGNPLSASALPAGANCCGRSSTMKDNCSYRFDAILAVALEQDARQELAALPTPAALKELYPDTSSLAPHNPCFAHPAPSPKSAAPCVGRCAAGCRPVGRHPCRQRRSPPRGVHCLLRFLPIEMQVTYAVDGTPLDTLPENYCDHYVPEGFVLDEENSLSTDFLLLHGYHTTASANGDSLSYTVKCYPIQATGQIETFDNEHTTWSSVTVKGHSATLGTSSTVSGTPCYFLFWESDGIQHTVSGCIDRDTLFRIAESIF